MQLYPATVPAASSEIAAISSLHIAELIVIQISNLQRLQMPTARMLCVLTLATSPAEAFKDRYWSCARCGWKVEADDPQTGY